MRKKRKDNKTRSDLSVRKRKTTNRKRAVAKKRATAPKTRNAGRWSESTFWQMIRSALRQRSRFWVPRLKCLEGARRPSQSVNKRLKWEFQCCECKEWFPQKFVEVHHTIPVGTLQCAADLPGFVERLFCEDGLAVICKNCHANEHQKTE